LAENPRARIALRQNMPKILTEIRLIENMDDSSKKSLKLLNDTIVNNEGDAQANLEGGAFL